jgi:hypothetical protein
MSVAAGEGTSNEKVRADVLIDVSATARDAGIRWTVVLTHL